jgi:surfeit locus 1 family protein
VPLKFCSRIFAPRPFTTLVTLALLALLISLGRWQLRRADEQQRLFDGFAAGTDASLAVAAGTPPLPRYQHVEARGRYDTSHQVLIDNMVSDDGRAGYYVITPFALRGGGWLLVNRGWIPAAASRAVLPDVPVPEDERTLHGRIDKLPSAGLHMGHPEPLVAPFPVRATFPTRLDLEGLLHEPDLTSAGDVVLLDGTEPDGYLRRWKPPGFAPMRHLAYAVQWFGLAATLTVIYVATNLKRA